MFSLCLDTRHDWRELSWGAECAHSATPRPAARCAAPGGRSGPGTGCRRSLENLETAQLLQHLSMWLYWSLILTTPGSGSSNTRSSTISMKMTLSPSTACWMEAMCPSSSSFTGPGSGEYWRMALIFSPLAPFPSSLGWPSQYIDKYSRNKLAIEQFSKASLKIIFYSIAHLNCCMSVSVNTKLSS